MNVCGLYLRARVTVPVVKASHQRSETMIEHKLADEILDKKRGKGAREGRPQPKHAHGLLDGSEERDARERPRRFTAFARWS
jgi:hypothetical protein